MKKTVYLLLLVGLVILGGLFWFLRDRGRNEGWTALGDPGASQSDADQAGDGDLPWEIDGKNPEDYTLEEYEALSEYQKECFTASFPSIRKFEDWLASVQPQELPYPWEIEGIRPEDYSFQAYEALTMAQKEAFKNSFGSIPAFETWLEANREQEEILRPWETEGISPTEYTYSQFQSLTVEQKEAFIATFSDPEAFETWLSSVEPKDEHESNSPDKPVEEYTWEEFEALSTEEKNAFIEKFASVESFETWMEEVKP